MANTNKTRQVNKKKKLIRTKRESLIIRAIIILVVLIAAGLIWYLVDSRSYIASVAGNRIKKYEYEFLLRQQIIRSEENWGISSKSDEEKEQYWLKTEGGQNPWEAAKNEALNTSKKYMIQLIKAREMGLTVDNSVRSEVNQTLSAYQQQLNLSDSDFARWVRQSAGVTLDEYRRMLQNTKVNEKFRNEHLKKYTPAEISEDEARSEYENNFMRYDTADISYILLRKFDEMGGALTQEQINKKMETANEILGKIQSGEDMDQLIAEYSEEGIEGSDQPAGKLSVNGNDYLQFPYFHALFDFALQGKAGDSGIVDTDMAIFIVKIDKHTGFDDVKDSVVSYLESSRENEWYNAELEKWSSETRFNVIKNNPVYDSITYQYYASKK